MSVSQEEALIDNPDNRQAFAFLRKRIFRNTISELMKSGRLRLSIGLFCCMIFWAGMFVLFLGGFHFIETFRLTEDLYEYLFGIFFFTLFVMLMVSNGIIIYAGIFHSRESNWLMTQPVREDLLFLHKFIESVSFASWGVLLLGSPVLVAYGLSVSAPALYFISIIPLLISFVGLPACLGATAAMIIAVTIPRRPKTILVTVASILVIFAGRFIWSIVQTPGTTLTADWMNGLLDQLSFSRNPMLPSRWMSASVVGFATRSSGEAIFYLGLITSNAGMAFLVSTWTAKSLLRPAYYRAQGSSSARKRKQSVLLDNWLHRIFFFLARPVRVLIIKDARCFLRDPAQWSQFFIFFGLLAAYFWNIRKLSVNLESLVWRNLISFLNLSVTALLLATFTSRFIFPMMSLEGRNAWMLNLLPVRRSQILWGKFAFSVSLAIISSETLLILSDVQLGVFPELIAVHILLMIIICTGLSAISVGLGAKLPNYRESDPSKIAAGFGGTLNLVISLLFLLITIGLIALPCHLYFLGSESGQGFRRISFQISEQQFYISLTVAIFFNAILGVLAVVIPIRLGLKALDQQEF